MSMIGYLKMIDDTDLHHLDSDPTLVEDLIDQDYAKHELLTVDKTWAALHFAIAGELYPDGDRLLSGAFVGQHIVDFDLEFGPPAFLFPEEVEKLSLKLEQISLADIEAALRSERFKESDIYPFSEGDESEDEVVAYVLPYFDQVQAFYRLAAEKGKGVLIWIM